MDANPYSAPAMENPPRSGPTRTVVRINPLQLGKILGVTYALISLLLIPIFLFMAVANPRGAGIGIAVAIFLPVFYGVAGLIGGVIFGWIYNICAKLVGGIEVEVE